MRSPRESSHGTTHAARDEHLVEARAGADDEQDRRRWREAVVAELEHLLTTEAARPNQRPEGEEEGDEQGNDRVPREAQRRACHAVGGERRVRGRGEQHEQHGHQHSEERDREARKLRERDIALRELRGERVVRRQWSSRRDPCAVEGTRERGRREADDEAVEHGAPDVRSEGGDGEHRRRMRWEHPVHHRQTGDERNAELHE